MKEWTPAESFKEELRTRKISITQFSRITGTCRSTIHKWIERGEVPMEALRTIRNLTTTEQCEFDSLMLKTRMTLDSFCELTGTNVATVSKWRRDNHIPKWAIVLLKQQLAIMMLKSTLAQQSPIN